MKKWVSVLTICGVIFSLAGCVNGNAIDAGKVSSESVAKPTDSTTTQTFQFQINSDMPIYACTVTISDDACPQITKITITDANTRQLIQSIIPKNNEVFTKSPVYFMDITFHGNLSLIIPLERSASFACFNAYIWNAEKMQFIETPSFSNIGNPAVDQTNKRILSQVSQSQITSYSMYAFQDNRFSLTNSIYWEPAELNPSTSSQTDGFLYFAETKDASAEIVQEFYIKSLSSDDIDRDAPQIQSYFTADSFWDLNGSKWQSLFWREVKQ